MQPTVRWPAGCAVVVRAETHVKRRISAEFTWSKPAHTPFGRSHASKAAITPERKEMGISNRIAGEEVARGAKALISSAPSWGASLQNTYDKGCRYERFGT